MASDRSWERQQGEGDAAWAAFEMYRSLGAGRSLEVAAARLGRSLSTLKKHSSRWRWRSRTAAWDAEVARRGDEAALGEVERLRRAQVKDLAEISAKLFKAFEAAAAADEFNGPTAVRLFFEAVKLQRLVVGESTETVKVEPKPDLSVLSAEQLGQLRVIQERLRDGES